MDRDEKPIFLRILDTATKTIALVAVVVVASAAGLNAYLVYQPGALEAQAVDVTAANTPVNGTTEPAACQSEIATAAARGTPDTESVVTDQSDLQFEDHCVAAVLNPAVTTLGPNNPGSYMCVGKSAKVTVVAGGLITETAVPDPAVPAGTCTAVACSSPDASGVSDCIAANNLTSLSSDSITSDLAQAGSPTVMSDTGITSFSMNADGSIVPESGNTASVLDSATGDQAALQDSASISSQAPETGSAVPSIQDSAAESVPNTTVVSPDTADVAPANTASPSATPVSDTDVTATAPPAQPATVGSVDVATTPTADTGTIDMNSIVFQDPDAAVEPTTPTLPDSGGAAGNFDGTVSSNASVSSGASDPSGNWFTKLSTDVTAGVNDIKTYLGFPLVNAPQPNEIPATIGIRG